MGHARLERVLLVGTRSADYIRASGHSCRIQRPYTWLPPTRSLKCQTFPLHRGRRPYMALLYGPAARCKPKMIDLEKLVLRFCIRPIDGALRLLAIMDYPRAFDLIRVSAPKARRAT